MDMRSFRFGNFFNKEKLSDVKTEERITTNQIATENFDGAIEIDGLSQFMFNPDWSYNSQSDLIKSYRAISNYAIVDYAIEDVINEMVSFSEDEEPVELDLSDLEEEISENIRKKIYESWDKIISILDLKNTIHRRARSFYIDGRLAYQKVVDANKTKDGLLDVVELNTPNITKIRKKEYDPQTKTLKSLQETFFYKEDDLDIKKGTRTTTQQQTYKEGFELNPESIVYVTSGMIDHLSGLAVSWLHKAVNPANKLMMMENALLIYRITRAPERRIFYVDVSNMPTTKAKAYLENLKNMYQNRMSFDPEAGNFTDKRHLQTMQENYWLPRNSNGKGTEVSTLPGGQNLGEIEDVVYFQKQLYKALLVPLSRLEAENSIIGGRGAEISRDEMKHLKNVSKIRKRFNRMLLDLLRTDLILTGVMTIQEWNKWQSKINLRYAQDLYMEEMRRNEIMRERLSLVQEMREYIGKYFSHKYVREEILKQTEQDRVDMDKEIEEESKDPKYKVEEDDPQF